MIVVSHKAEITPGIEWLSVWKNLFPLVMVTARRRNHAITLKRSAMF